MALLKINSDKNFTPTKKEDNTSFISTIELGLREAKTTDNKFGWSIVDKMPYDEPCVLYLGGDGTTDDKAANGNAKIIEEYILKPLGIKVPVYSVKYSFSKYNAIKSRGIAFSKYRANPLNNEADDKKIYNNVTADDINPQYIDTLYRKVIEPRITSEDGKEKLSLEEACRRMRMMTIVAHCHGGFVALELEKKMKDEMKKIGYSADEQKQILSQMLTIAHAPACALGVAKSQMISFITASDTVWPKSVTRRVANNLFNNYLYDRNQEHNIHFQAIMGGNEERAAKNREFNLEPCYFSAEQGNAFLIREKWQRTKKDMFEVNFAEHNDVGYGYAGKTSDGKLMTYISANIIKNGIKNSLLQKEGFTPLPDIESLIYSGNKEADSKLSSMWKKMIANGKALRNEVFQHFMTKRRARGK